MLDLLANLREAFPIGFAFNFFIIVVIMLYNNLVLSRFYPSFVWILKRNLTLAFLISQFLK